MNFCRCFPKVSASESSGEQQIFNLKYDISFYIRPCSILLQCSMDVKVEGSAVTVTAQEVNFSSPICQTNLQIWTFECLSTRRWIRRSKLRWRDWFVDVHGQLEGFVCACELFSFACFKLLLLFHFLSSETKMLIEKVFYLLSCSWNKSQNRLKL